MTNMELARSPVKRLTPQKKSWLSECSNDELPVHIPAKIEHESVASEATTKSFLETTPLKSYLNPDSLSS